MPLSLLMPCSWEKLQWLAVNNVAVDPSKKNYMV